MCRQKTLPLDDANCRRKFYNKPHIFHILLNRNPVFSYNDSIKNNTECWTLNVVQTMCFALFNSLLYFQHSYQKIKFYSYWGLKWGPHNISTTRTHKDSHCLCSYLSNTVFNTMVGKCFFIKWKVVYWVYTIGRSVAAIEFLYWNRPYIDSHAVQYFYELLIFINIDPMHKL